MSWHCKEKIYLCQLLSGLKRLMRLATLSKFELWFVQNVGILVSQLEAANEEFNSKKLIEEIKRTNTVNKGSCKNACYPLASEQALYFEWWTKLAAREHGSESLASSLSCGDRAWLLTISLKCRACSKANFLLDTFWLLNPFASGNFAEKRVLKLTEPFLVTLWL